MDGMPVIAVKDFFFWAFAIMLLGIITGFATRLGAILVGKIWPKEKEEGRDRRSNPLWIREMLSMYRESLELNARQVNEFSNVARGIEGMAKLVIERHEQAAKEHQEILYAVREKRGHS